jgi:hypothetical protein
MYTKNTRIVIALLILTAVVVIQTLIIQVIWNRVIIKKFPNSNIQKLDFIDALALSVFCALLSGKTYIINSKDM